MNHMYRFNVSINTEGLSAVEVEFCLFLLIFLTNIEFRQSLATSCRSLQTYPVQYFERHLTLALKYQAEPYGPLEIFLSRFFATNFGSHLFQSRPKLREKNLYQLNFYDCWKLACLP